MKKKYLEVALEIRLTDVEDVLTGSPNGGYGIDWSGNWGDGNGSQGE